MSRNNKVLIVTHPMEFYDPHKRILKNLESFVNGYPDYDIIRILDSELGGDYFKMGEALESNSGYLSMDQTAQIISEYNTIVTAGGFFDFCALNTFKCLANPKFRNSDNPLKIIVPLDLFYFYDGWLYGDNIHGVTDFAKHAKRIFFMRIYQLDSTFNEAVRNIEEKNPYKNLLFKDQDVKIKGNRLDVWDLDIFMEGIFSYRQLSGARE